MPRPIPGWFNFHTYPFYFFYYYAPKRFSGVISEESCEIQKMVWNFKDGKNSSDVAELVKFKLKEAFPSLRSYKNLTFACLPASTNFSNSRRYEDFSEEVCDELRLYNAFPHISITKEKSPSHLGGSDAAEFALDHQFFSGKNVILFDDVVTRGHAMQSFIKDLEFAGANVVACMAIGRTTLQSQLGEAHPFNGHHIQGPFVLSCHNDLYRVPTKPPVDFNPGSNLSQVNSFNFNSLNDLF